MDTLTELLQQEMAKLRILKSETARQEQKVAVLKAMQTGGELDAVLSRQVAAAPASNAPALKGPTAAEPVQVEIPSDDGAAKPARPPRRGRTKDALLLALATGPQHLQAVLASVQSNGVDITYAHARTQLWTFSKEKFPLVSSSAKGIYELTAAGTEYVRKIEGETPGGAGVSGATKSSQG